MPLPRIVAKKSFKFFILTKCIKRINLYILSALFFFYIKNIRAPLGACPSGVDKRIKRIKINLFLMVMYNEFTTDGNCN